MKLPAIALLSAMSLAIPAYASSHSEMADGEIRKVDRDAKKITIKHGPLANLDMPPMTMVFQVKDPAMLDQVKAGDKVKFQAEKVGGAFTVTKIEPTQ
jgi:Cu/Ag efflux protein CusF